MGRSLKKIILINAFLLSVVLCVLVFCIRAYRTEGSQIFYSHSKAFLCNENWYDDQGNTFNLEKVAFEKSDLDKEFIFHYRIPSDLEIKDNDALCFFTRGLDFKAYIRAREDSPYKDSKEYGSRQIFEFHQNGAGLAGSDIGLISQIVPLAPTDSGNEITFVVTPAEHSAFLIHLRIEDSSAFIYTAIRARLFPFAGSLLIAFFGVATILYTLFALETEGRKKLAWYAFGSFMFILGLLLLIQSQVLQILTGKPEIFTTLKYVFLVLLCFPQAVKNDCFTRSPHRDLSIVIGWCVTILLILETLLNLFSEASYYRLFWIAGIIMLFNYGVTVVRMVKDLKWCKNHPEVSPSFPYFLIMIILGLSALVDFGIYFYLDRHITDWGKIIRITNLILILILLVRLLRVSIIRNKEVLLAARYKKEARTDALTGLFNKGAFMEREIDLTARFMHDGPDLKKLKPFVLVSLDLNNLKKVNDQLGHSVGDDFIKSGAGILRESIPPSSEIYRVGGDEFIILIFHENVEESYQQMVEKLRSLEKAYNDAHAGSIPLSFACGHALCQLGQKGAISAAEKEADQEMYECKREMKVQR